MENEQLAELFYRRRNMLGLSQDYMGAKLDMSQPGISWIESGKIKISPRLLEDIKAIKGFEDFDQPGALLPDNQNAPKTLADKWRWGKPLLYASVLIAGALILEKIFSIGEEFYRGMWDNAQEKKDIMGIIAWLYFLSGATFIYWLVFRRKLQ